MNLTKANLLLLGAAAVLAVPTWITVTGERDLYVDVAAVPRMFEGFTPDSVAQLVLGTPKAARDAASRQSCQRWQASGG